jgi:hypothetical protein
MQMLDRNVEHVIALALDKSRTIHYRAILGDARREAYSRVSLIMGHVAESVGAHLKANAR